MQGKIICMRSIYLVLVVCFLASCGDETPPITHHHDINKEVKSNEAKTPATPITSNLGSEGTPKLMGVINRYYDLKNAMVATNATTARDAAQHLTLAADSLLTVISDAATSHTALKPYLDTIIKKTIMIAAVTDATCEKQRVSFEAVSNNLYRILKETDIKNAGIYHEFCPMAFNDKGAYWLSNDPDIKNPYFGKKMLECGEVIDSMK